MIDKIKQFFTVEIANNNLGGQHACQIATAALLIEVMTIDHHIEKVEQVKIAELLTTIFTLDKKSVDKLLTLAHEETHHATSIYQFTSLINDHFSASDKFDLVTNLWRVAFADGELDKYEEGIIRKICDLIYVSHSQFIKAKHTARSDLDT